MMRNALIRWLVLTISVFAAVVIVPGIRCENALSLLIAALILGILNTFVKPLLTLLSLPFIILTVGIFVLVINALLLMFTGWVVPHFYVESFLSALGGAIIISLVGLFFGGGSRTRVQVKQRQPRQGDSKPPPGKGPVIDV